MSSPRLWEEISEQRNKHQRGKTRKKQSFESRSSCSSLQNRERERERERERDGFGNKLAKKKEKEKENLGVVLLEFVEEEVESDADISV